MAITSMTQAPRKQRGFSIIEMAVGLAVALIVLGVTVSFIAGLGRDAQRAKVADQEARELAQIARATKQHIANKVTDTSAFPLNTNMVITPSTLATGGFLPASFANRDGSGASITPLGHAYRIVIRRINANEVPTAVVYEQGAALPEKLPPIGIEAGDGSIMGLKQDIAGLAARNYQVIAATIASGTRTARGVNDGFTKDLTAWFDTAFAESSPVVLVNFKDLDPDGGGTTPPGEDPPTFNEWDKQYDGCQLFTKGPITNAPPGSIQWSGMGGPCAITPRPECAYTPGWHYQRSDIISTCLSGVITPVANMGALTNGMGPETYRANDNDCLNQQGPCYNEYYVGTVTMNMVMVATERCHSMTWQNGVQRRVPTYGETATFVGACCQYQWRKPGPAVPGC